LAELAPALYRNASIKVLDISFNLLNDTESAEILRDILRSNKTMIALKICLEMIFGKQPALLSVLQMAWAATQHYRRSTFHAVTWEMAVFPLWRKLSALGTRRYGS
jgi:hypothetical protein